LPPNDAQLEPPLFIDPLQDALFAQGLEIPVMPCPGPSGRVVRVSAQLYNDTSEYRLLADALRALLG
jgi:hypothetical protein